MAEELRPLSADEMSMAVEGPAIFCNRVFVTVVGPTLRIAFLEQGSKALKPAFRTAVTLIASDALELGSILTKLAPTATFTAPTAKTNA